VTDEALFYRRFVSDVRRCAGGRAPTAVAEIERRIRVAMIAAPGQRERRWARVVAAVADLLARFAGGDQETEAAALARLREFVRENADLGRPHDVAITDFRFDTKVESVLVDGAGRAYLILAHRPGTPRRRPPEPALEEIVPGPTRRLAEWAVFGLCGGAAAAALWFAFVVPV